MTGELRSLFGQIFMKGVINAGWQAIQNYVESAKSQFEELIAGMKEKEEVGN